LDGHAFTVHDLNVLYLGLIVGVSLRWLIWVLNFQSFHNLVFQINSSTGKDSLDLWHDSMEIVFCSNIIYHWMIIFIHD
jgi:hypothetical protein